MVFFVVNFIGNISRYRLLKRENWALLVLHLSWVFIIIGAGITRYFGNEGVISLREGETTNTYLSDRTYITIMVDGNYQGGGRLSNDASSHLSQTSRAQNRRPR